MVTSIAVEIVGQCPRCKQPMAFRGAPERLRCGSCAHVLELEAALWGDLLVDVGRAALDSEGSLGRVSTVMLLERWGLIGRVQSARAPVACPRCNRSLEVETLEALRARSGAARCPACSNTISVREAPSALTDVLPGLRGVAAEQLTVGEGSEGALAFSCAACGAAITVDGTSRHVSCGACSMQLLAPDALWATLHPGVTAGRWYLLFGDAGVAQARANVDDVRPPPPATASQARASHTPSFAAPLDVVATGARSASSATRSTGTTATTSPPQRSDEPTLRERSTPQRHAATPQAGARPAPPSSSPQPSRASAVGPLPTECWQFVAMTTDPRGRIVLAWHEDDPEEHPKACRLGVAEHDGGLVWVRKDVSFSHEAMLQLDRSHGLLVLIDPGQGRVSFFDPMNGALVRELVGPTEAGDASSLNVRDAGYGFGDVVLDADGSFLVNKAWDDRADTALRRFGPDGKPVAVWPGLWPDAGRDDECPEWDALGDQPTAIPDFARFARGWDGCFYAVDEAASYVAKWGSAGQLLGVVRTGIDSADEVLDLDATANGTLHVLFVEAAERDGVAWTHVVRIDKAGHIEPWLGLLYAERPLVGASDQFLEVSPEGLLYLASDFDSLRVIAPDGEVRFKSAATRQYEADYLRAAVVRARAAQPVPTD